MCEIYGSQLRIIKTGGSSKVIGQPEVSSLDYVLVYPVLSFHKQLSVYPLVGALLGSKVKGLKQWCQYERTHHNKGLLKGINQGIIRAYIHKLVRVENDFFVLLYI